jgi:hypothetical protein
MGRARLGATRERFSAARRTVLASLLWAGLGGCTLAAGSDDPALVGKWKGVGPQEYLNVALDGTGDAKIHRTSPNACDLYYKIDTKAPNVGWQQRGEEKFTIPLAIQGCIPSPCSDCVNEDFTMTCNGVTADSSSMTCAGANKWANTNFTWKRK